MIAPASLAGAIMIFIDGNNSTAAGKKLS